MVTDAPDSAYELCTKYAPNCDDSSSTSSTFTINQQTKKSESSQTSKKSKNKSKSGKKNKKSSSSAASSSNSEITRNLKPNRRQIVSQDNSVELESAGFGFNGEDDYYDSLNSGNEDAVFGTERPILPFNPVEPNFENEFDESLNQEPGLTVENVKNS